MSFELVVSTVVQPASWFTEENGGEEKTTDPPNC